MSGSRVECYIAIRLPGGDKCMFLEAASRALSSESMTCFMLNSVDLHRVTNATCCRQVSLLAKCRCSPSVAARRPLPTPPPGPCSLAHAPAGPCSLAHAMAPYPVATLNTRDLKRLAKMQSAVVKQLIVPKFPAGKRIAKMQVTAAIKVGVCHKLCPVFVPPVRSPRQTAAFGR